MTRIKRITGVAATTVVLAALLSGCFGGGTPTTTDPGTGSGTGTEQTTDSLAGTSWSGTDSDGDEWAFDFQDDGTVGLTYNGSSYDDPSDTWKLSGGSLSIHTAFDDGDVDMTGPYADGASSIDLNGTYAGGTFTLTITQ